MKCDPERGGNFGASESRVMQEKIWETGHCIFKALPNYFVVFRPRVDLNKAAKACMGKLLKATPLPSPSAPVNHNHEIYARQKFRKRE